MKEDNVIETVVQLMRLTRENKIKWEHANENNGFLNTYVGQVNELEFRLKEVLSPEARDLHVSDIADLSLEILRGVPNYWYRLTIKDRNTSEEILIPYSHVVNDLGVIVANKTDRTKTLTNLTERLKAL